MIELNKTHYEQQFQQAQKLIGANHLPWFKSLRQQALDELLQQGLPHNRLEEWKYTNLSPIAKKSFEVSSAIDASIIASHLQADDLALVFINGEFSVQLSSSNYPAGLQVQTLKTALAENPELIEKLLKNSSLPQLNNIAVLNTALFTNGTLIHIEKNTQLDSALRIYHFNSNQDAPNMSHLRHFIVAEANSRASIIEYHLGIDDSQYFSTTLSNLHVDAGAQLHHYKVQQESDKAYHIGQIHGLVEQDAQLNLFNLDLGSRLARTDSHVILSESGAHCDMAGLYMCAKKQHIDNHTSIDHKKAHTTSDEFYKGILADRSRAVFNGKVIVCKDAQKINANQTNKNLLLSKNAEVDTKPQLEIYADDVKCSHGATVGQLDENSLFYLRSRGIDEETAKAALTFGFAKDILQKVHDEKLFIELETMILNRFSHSNRLQELL